MNRRNLLKVGMASAGTIWALGKANAASGMMCNPSPTPPQPEGPFYPISDQVDTDADLIRVAGRTQIAKGQIVIVDGRVTDQDCAPVAGVLVEIWQACESGKYDHPSDPNTAELDPNFQYWGKAVTDAYGIYRFRTIIPGAYPAGRTWIRPPHIHFKVSKLGYRELITQMYFEGFDLNEQDRILQGLSKSEQEKVIVKFERRKEHVHPAGHFPIEIERLV